jgi:hypothetical protein
VPDPELKSELASVEAALRVALTRYSPITPKLEG